MEYSLPLLVRNTLCAGSRLVCLYVVTELIGNLEYNGEEQAEMRVASRGAVGRVALVRYVLEDGLRSEAVSLGALPRILPAQMFIVNTQDIPIKQAKIMFNTWICSDCFRRHRTSRVTSTGC